jgi:hypothetical protein
MVVTERPSRASVSLPEAMNSREELEALLRVKVCVRVTDGMYYSLELRDLVEKGLKNWQLTKAGEYQLAAGM